MSFFSLSRENISGYTPGEVHIQEKSTQSVIQFKDKLYYFYVQHGTQDVYYTTTGTKAKTFSQRVSIKASATAMIVAPNSGASAVVFNGRIYLFYNDAAKNNGTMYTHNDGIDDQWSQPKSVLAQLDDNIPTWRNNTSPAAAVYNGKIHLVWVPEGDMKGLPCATYDGTTWGTVAMENELGTMIAGSPTLATFKDTLYLFIVAWGAVMYVTRYDSKTWTHPTSVSNYTGPQDVRPSSTAGAAVWGDRLCVTWSGSGFDGTLFTLTDGVNWSTQQPIGLGQASQVLEGTSPISVFHHYQPWVFQPWKQDHTVWARRASAFCLEATPWSTQATLERLTSQIVGGDYFSIFSYNTTTAGIMAKKFGKHYEVQDLGDLLNHFGGNDGSAVTSGSMLVFAAILYALTQRPEYYHIAVTTNAESHSFVVSFNIRLNAPK